MTIGVFGLKQVYKKQIENIDNQNFNSWPESGNYGYYAGRFSAGSTIFRLDFSNEVCSNPGKNLPQSRGIIASTKNLFYGYFGGGYSSGTIYATVSKLDFATENVNNITDNFVNGRYAMGAVSSKTHGYYGSGFRTGGATITSNVSKLDFSSETLTSPGINLYWSGYLGSIHDSQFGYFSSGWYSTAGNVYYSSIYRLDFLTDTVTDLPSKIFANCHSTSTETANNLYGYFIAGRNPSVSPGFFSQVSRFDFSNDTSSYVKNYPLNTFQLTSSVSNSYAFLGGDPLGFNFRKLEFSTESFSTSPASTLYTLDYTSATTSSTSYPRSTKTYGYINGGRVYLLGITSNTNRIDFSTEVSTLRSNSSANRGYGFSTSNNNFGYITGGQLDPIELSTNYVTSVDRLDFSNETYALLPSNIPQRKEASTVESNSYGYFCGGASPGYLGTVVRIDFGNETLSAPGKNMSTYKRGAGSASSRLYGYISSGQFVSNTQRLDFSTEVFNSLSPVVNQFFGNDTGVQNNLYGYFGGGYTVDSAIYRIDFSSETVNYSGKNLPEGRFYIHTLSSEFYGYFAGGFLSGAPQDQRSIVERLDFSTENISVSPNPLSYAVSVGQPVSNSN